MGVTFYAAVLQYDGKVVGRAKHRSDDLRASESRAKFILGYRRMFDHYLPVPFKSKVTFREPLSDQKRVVLHWTQPNEFAAYPMFEVGGKFGVLAACLTGAITVADQIAVQGFESVLAEFNARCGHSYCPRLADIPERPVIVLVRFAAPAEDLGFIETLAVCLAVAWFEKMADAGKKSVPMN